MNSAISATLLVALAGASHAQIGTPQILFSTSDLISNLDLGDGGEVVFEQTGIYDEFAYYGSVTGGVSQVLTAGFIRSAEIDADGNAVIGADFFGASGTDGIYDQNGLVQARPAPSSFASATFTAGRADLVVETQGFTGDSIESSLNGVVFGSSSFISSTTGFGTDGSMGVNDFSGSLRKINSDGSQQVIFTEGTVSGAADLALNSFGTSTSGGVFGFITDDDLASSGPESVTLSDGTTTKVIATEGVGPVASLTSFAPGVNDSFDAVFRAVNLGGAEALFYYNDSLGSLTELVAIGDLIGGETLNSFSGAAILNNNDQVVFVARVGGGRDVVTIAVPAPGVAGLLALAGVAGVRRRRS